MRSFIREKVVHSGKEFLYPEVYPYTGIQQDAVKKRRAKRTKETEPKQKALNDRRAKRYFIQLANANFGAQDYAVHLTYSPENLPESTEEAQRIAKLFLQRVARRRIALGLPPLKYLMITQTGEKKDGTHRLHHHIMMNGGLPRDEIEDMWWKVKGTKTTEPVMYGWANVDRLKPNKTGIASMAGYMARDSAGKKRWTQSKNLTKPWFQGVNDTKYSKRQMEKIGKLPSDSEEFRKFWERRYRGWELVACEREYVDQSGWYFWLTMRRKPKEDKK